MNAILNATLSFLAHVMSVLTAAYTTCSEATTSAITSAVTTTKGKWASLRSNVATRIAAHAAKAA